VAAHHSFTAEFGDVVTVEGSLAKNGSNRLNARSVKLAGTGLEPGRRSMRRRARAATPTDGSHRIG
jgi:hypothetical protein